jgi:hypothetical protein
MSKFDSKPQKASYAAGGTVLGRTRSFLKSEDEFREADEKESDNSYGKSGDGAGHGETDGAPPARKSKVLDTVKPRK